MMLFMKFFFIKKLLAPGDSLAAVFNYHNFIRQLYTWSKKVFANLFSLIFQQQYYLSTMVSAVFLLRNKKMILISDFNYTPFNIKRPVNYTMHNKFSNCFVWVSPST